MGKLTSWWDRQPWADQGWEDLARSLDVVFHGQVAMVPELSSVGPVVIRHGRDDVDSQPGAATVTLSLRRAGLERMPEVGLELELLLSQHVMDHLGLPEAARRRFGGRITNVVAVPAYGRHEATVRVTAASNLADYGRRRVGAEPWPAESDGDRAARILNSAALGGGNSSDGTVWLLPQDVDSQPALQLLHDLADDAGGVLVEQRNGILHYQDARHRWTALSKLTLTPRHVLGAGIQWEQQLAGVVNDVTVVWGSPPTEGAARPEVRVADPVSQSRRGVYEVKLDTQLNDYSGALAVAYSLLGRRSTPWWTIPELELVLGRTVTDPELWGALLELEQGDVVTLAGFPTSGGDLTGRAFVEGWTERWSRDGWELALALSPYGLTGAAPTYATLPYGAAAPGGKTPRTNLARNPRFTAGGAAPTEWLPVPAGRTKLVRGLWRVTAENAAVDGQPTADRGVEQTGYNVGAGSWVTVGADLWATSEGVYPGVAYVELADAQGTWHSTSGEPYDPYLMHGRRYVVRAQVPPGRQLTTVRWRTDDEEYLTAGSSRLEVRTVTVEAAWTDGSPIGPWVGTPTYESVDRDLTYLQAQAWDAGESDLARYLDAPSDRSYASLQPAVGQAVSFRDYTTPRD